MKTMKTMKTKCMLISFALGLGLALALLWALAGATLAASHAEGPAPSIVEGPQRLAQCSLLQAGDVLTVCPAVAGTCPYTNVQDAVDAAHDGDVIKVAAGTYSGVNNHGGLAQVVYIGKTITVRGGYTTTDGFADPPDPVANLTTLDARGQGRGLYVTGDIAPTVEGLRITGGDAAGLGGGEPKWDGGFYDVGGGVYVVTATALISDNQVVSNTAYTGGGVYLRHSDATLNGNTVAFNTTGHNGGGVALYYSGAALNGNTVASNHTAHQCGGLILYEANGAVLSDNVISGNTAVYDAGGLGVYFSGPVTLSGNEVISNVADQCGGGLYLYFADADCANNVVAGNQAGTVGSGLYVNTSHARLAHTTIARNSGGDDSGVHVTGYDLGGGTYLPSSVAMSNTILVSHTVGITVVAGSTPTLEATLWGAGDWANGSDAGGTGAVVTGTRNYRGDPDFVAPGAGDYHIGAASAARDRGVNAGVSVDVDGDVRPRGDGYDIGADEFPDPLSVSKQATPVPAGAGARLTYTIRAVNFGGVSLNATITDHLPGHVAPTGVRTWAPDPIPPGAVWTGTVVVTVEMGYSGPLTNVVEVTTEEGATGAGSLTVSVVCYKNYLPLVLRQSP